MKVVETEACQFSPLAWGVGGGSGFIRQHSCKSFVQKEFNRASCLIESCSEMASSFSLIKEK